ncbi:MAG TPA: c-type cytochrome [Mucilaginibacter sp.]|nr:c-type cytochrome [Mucilaginibacter sp.]
MLINKKIFITLGLLSGIVVFASMTSIQQAQQEEPKPVNLKVLPKNISHKDLERVMGNWAASLGVRCNFCHARNEETKKTDFASDAKPEKEMARHMYLMAAKINKKYFKVDSQKDSIGMMKLTSVNCYTCHHGVAHLEAATWPKRGGGPGPGPGGQGMGAPGMGGNPPMEKKP